VRFFLSSIALSTWSASTVRWLTRRSNIALGFVGREVADQGALGRLLTQLLSVCQIILPEANALGPRYA
jgi:hypothetical protein